MKLALLESNNLYKIVNDKKIKQIKKLSQRIMNVINKLLR